jgi:pyruvate ferredoxin oxidoreductase alpha subunit
MEAKRNQAEGMKHVNQVVLDVAKEFEAMSGRSYGLYEEYCMDDAEYAVVMIGSAAGTTKDAIDRLRAQGEKVGLIKIRMYRPFPADELAKSLANVKAVAIMDRAEGYTNHGGPLGADVMSALYRARSQAYAVNYIYGLGGRDVRVEDMEGIFATLKQIDETGEVGETYRYLGIRE